MNDDDSPQCYIYIKSKSFRTPYRSSYFFVSEQDFSTMTYCHKKYCARQADSQLHTFSEHFICFKLFSNERRLYDAYICVLKLNIYACNTLEWPKRSATTDCQCYKNI